MTRPVKHRRGARIVVLADDEVLLINDSDPGVADSGWWVTPGGGVDGDESTRTAAARELWEETGLELSPSDLGDPVLTRTVVHGYSDRILVQEEDFYRVRVPRFTPSAAGLTDTELQRMGEMRWFPLAALPSPVWPSDLAGVATTSGRLDARAEEESTVPVSQMVLRRFGVPQRDGGRSRF